MSRINIAVVKINLLNPSKASDEFWSENEIRLLSQINAKVPKSIELDNQGSSLTINIQVNRADDLSLTLETDESYKLSSNESEGKVIVEIRAETVFGARHALETLSQLVVYDDIRNELQVSLFIVIQ